MSAFHSKFGGMWIDDLDAGRVEHKVSAIADPVVRGLVGSFVRDGYAILEQGVSHATIDTYLAEYERAANAPDSFQVNVRTAGGRQAFTREKSLIPGAKVLDTGMLLPHGQDLWLAPKIAAFLEAIFEEKALAFQTLHFEVGSTQAVHQDTAYVWLSGVNRLSLSQAGLRCRTCSRAAAN
jgi:phytanoyl-CoA hydroxylase